MLNISASALSKPSPADTWPCHPLSTEIGSDIDTGIRIEKKGLYLILWSTGFVGRYHWGVLVAKSDMTGILFHQSLKGPERKSLIEDMNVSVSQDLLTALKIGVIEDISDEWIGAVKGCVQSTEVEGEFTCRAWALSTIYELADGGFIGLSPEWDKINTIEKEAERLAKDALVLDTKIHIESQVSTP